MSTTTQKRSLAMALKDAIEFQALFAGCFEKWIVAGSARRQKREVGDIDHVVIPKFGEIPVGGDLFAEKKTGNLLWHRLDQLVSLGDESGDLRMPLLDKHLRNGIPRWGERQRSVDFHSFCNELWTANQGNLGFHLTIRTGPAEFSQKMVTRLRQNNYAGQKGDVWNLASWTCGCGFKGATPTWKIAELAGGFVLENFGLTRAKATGVCPLCQKHESMRPALMSVPDEESFFKLCGVGYIEPEARR